MSGAGNKNSEKSILCYEQCCHRAGRVGLLVEFVKLPSNPEWLFFSFKLKMFAVIFQKYMLRISPRIQIWVEICFQNLFFFFPNPPKSQCWESCKDQCLFYGEAISCVCNGVGDDASLAWGLPGYTPALLLHPGCLNAQIVFRSGILSWRWNAVMDPATGSGPPLASFNLLLNASLPWPKSINGFQALQLSEITTSMSYFSLHPKHISISRTLCFLHSITGAELRVFGRQWCFGWLMTVSSHATNTPRASCPSLADC